MWKRGISEEGFERLAKVSAIDTDFSDTESKLGENEIKVLKAVKEFNDLRMDGGTMQELADHLRMNIDQVAVNLDSLVELEYVDKVVKDSGVYYVPSAWGGWKPNTEEDDEDKYRNTLDDEDDGRSYRDTLDF